MVREKGERYGDWEGRKRKKGMVRGIGTRYGEWEGEKRKENRYSEREGRQI